MGYIQDDVVMINHFTVRTYRTEDIDPGVRQLKIFCYILEKEIGVPVNYVHVRTMKMLKMEE